MMRDRDNRELTAAELDLIAGGKTAESDRLIDGKEKNSGSLWNAFRFE